MRLALANSRMKDFFDIHRLAETRTFDGDAMRLAVAATFARRGLDIPNERPLALTSEFAGDTQKRVQWADRAARRRARMRQGPRRGSTGAPRLLGENRHPAR